MTAKPLVFLSILLWMGETFAAAPMGAVDVFTENAENYGADESDGNSVELRVAKAAQGENWWSFSTGAGRMVSVERDEEDHFSDGPQNRIIVFSRSDEATSQHNLVSNHFEPIACGQVSFDFFLDPSGGAAPGVRLLLMGTGVDYAQNLADYKHDAALAGIFIQNGAISNKTLRGTPGGSAVDFEPGRAHHLVLVFNNTSSSMNYANGSQVLAAGDMDLWLNGAKKATWPMGAVSSATASRALEREQADALAGTKGLWFNAQVPVRLKLDNIRMTRQVDVAAP